MTIDLNHDWVLRRADKAYDVAAGNSDISAPFSIPGDVHSALLQAGHIEDPYFRDNEMAVDWVNRCDWTIERTLIIDQPGNHMFLVLDQVDCVADIYINDALVGSVRSQFVRHVFIASSLLLPGKNRLSIHIRSAVREAAQKAAEFPFELPQSDNCRLPHANLLRKTPCHAGWDWNICLMPAGVYGQVCLVSCETLWIEAIKIQQHHFDNSVTLTVTARVHANEAGPQPCNVSICGVQISSTEDLKSGTQDITLQVQIDNPDLWWPAGSGTQTRHQLEVSIGDQQHSQLIGLRSARIVQTPDNNEGGSGFRIDINGRPIFMRGANWIPADALPQRCTVAQTRELLQSAVDANMNMLRVWGGGQYEADWFYELCDELGILIWQDFMFSCNHYPAADAQWLNLVRIEAQQQVWRLSAYASVVLWCGDNELVGALKWWDVTRNNRDRYLANYVRLNHALEEIVENELGDTDFWPSSPSVGKLNYGDGWKDDAAGDMHFWDVWHEARPFSAYQDIHPRFCSEFGFQSFPSAPVVETFTLPQDRNVSSPVMEIHQRNVGGNARIVETLVRYFEFPDSFERMLYLSQCQQAMAIRTGVEYWRLLQPHCMGTLYWQLNDTWPVASWSSLEYGGGWKLLHYTARRFYQPLLVAMVPGHQRFDTEGQYLLKVVNDTMTTETITVTARALTVTGTEQRRWQFTVAAEPGAVTTIHSFESVPPDCFLYWQWHDQHGNLMGDNEYWFTPYKNHQLPTPKIQLTESNDGDQKVFELQTDQPAFFVTINLGGNHVYSDNGFTLLPGEPKHIMVDRVLESERIPQLADITIQHL
jgi:beta-mannosidase